MMKKDRKSTWTECRTGYIRIIPENDAKNNGAEPEKNHNVLNKIKKCHFGATVNQSRRKCNLRENAM